ncbi:MAG: ABC transporter permease [Micrococcales bacterium 70-64]|nr:ABC transporter permease [Leifsonia sp.]ODU63167.1 MAG: ABC transporter permease [Leifsonia sp. SCN 70-46]OJX84858.1 MAG: ABC transporter permease [Micrococcales bacterium 70-64]
MTDQIPAKGQVPTDPEPGQAGTVAAPPSRSQQVLREIMGGSAMISVLAVLLALLVGAILIALTDKSVQAASGYFFSRPGDTFKAIWDAASGAYSALFQGSVYNFKRPGFAAGIRPLTETLTFATPLIAAGLGVAVSFRVGLFNIGGRGQMLVAAGAAGYVGFAWPLPFGIHLIVAVVAGIVAGAIWGGLVGLLKATTGAHEVIVTIMLNYIGFYLIGYMLRTQGLLQAPGSTNPKSAPMLETAVFPDLFGPQYNLHWGFVVVIAATAYVWYLINRSSMGFQFRAVGENPNAARVAGIHVKKIYVYAMLISGGLVGLAGVNQVLGTVTTGFSAGIDAGIGFDAITVALLGRSRPIGVFFAGILFGALKAGGYSMQAAQGIPIDIVLVVQSLIVLFIAAPPLVRAIFRLPVPGVVKAVRTPVTAARKAEVSK